MTLKDIRDTLSRMFAKDRALESREVNHVLIEDSVGIIHMDYMLNDDSDLEDDEDDSELEDDDDDSEWYDDDDSEIDDEY